MDAFHAESAAHPLHEVKGGDWLLPLAYYAFSAYYAFGLLGLAKKAQVFQSQLLGYLVIYAA